VPVVPAKILAEKKMGKIKAKLGMTTTKPSRRSKKGVPPPQSTHGIDSDTIRTATSNDDFRSVLDQWKTELETALDPAKLPISVLSPLTDPVRWEALPNAAVEKELRAKEQDKYIEDLLKTDTSATDDAVSWVSWTKRAAARQHQHLERLPTNSSTLVMQGQCKRRRSSLSTQEGKRLSSPGNHRGQIIPESTSAPPTPGTSTSAQQSLKLKRLLDANKQLQQNMEEMGGENEIGHVMSFEMKQQLNTELTQQGRGDFWSSALTTPLAAPFTADTVFGRSSNRHGHAVLSATASATGLQKQKIKNNASQLSTTTELATSMIPISEASSMLMGPPVSLEVGAPLVPCMEYEEGVLAAASMIGKTCRKAYNRRVQAVKIMQLGVSAALLGRKNRRVYAEKKAAAKVMIAFARKKLNRKHHGATSFQKIRRAQQGRRYFAHTKKHHTAALIQAWARGRAERGIFLKLVQERRQQLCREKARILQQGWKQYNIRKRNWAMQTIFDLCMHRRHNKNATLIQRFGRQYLAKQYYRCFLEKIDAAESHRVQAKANFLQQFERIHELLPFATSCGMGNQVLDYIPGGEKPFTQPTIEILNLSHSDVDMEVHRMQAVVGRINKHKLEHRKNTKPSKSTEVEFQLELARLIFKMFDFDLSGSIDLDEWQNLAAFLKNVLKGSFVAFDFDTPPSGDDDMVSLEEFRDWWSDIVQRNLDATTTSEDFEREGIRRGKITTQVLSKVWDTFSRDISISKTDILNLATRNIMKFTRETALADAERYFNWHHPSGFFYCDEDPTVNIAISTLTTGMIDSTVLNAGPLHFARFKPFWDRCRASRLLTSAPLASSTTLSASSSYHCELKDAGAWWRTLLETQIVKLQKWAQHRMACFLSSPAGMKELNRHADHWKEIDVLKTKRRELAFSAASNSDDDSRKEHAYRLFVSDVFEQFDIDGSGYIDADELDALHKTLGVLPEQFQKSSNPTKTQIRFESFYLSLKENAPDNKSAVITKEHRKGRNVLGRMRNGLFKAQTASSRLVQAKKVLSANVNLTVEYTLKIHYENMWEDAARCFAGKMKPGVDNVWKFCNHLKQGVFSGAQSYQLTLFNPEVLTRKLRESFLASYIHRLVASIESTSDLRKGAPSGCEIEFNSTLCITPIAFTPATPIDLNTVVLQCMFLRGGCIANPFGSRAVDAIVRNWLANKATFGALTHGSKTTKEDCSTVRAAFDSMPDVLAKMAIDRVEDVATSACLCALNMPTTIDSYLSPKVDNVHISACDLEDVGARLEKLLESQDDVTKAYHFCDTAKTNKQIRTSVKAILKKTGGNQSQKNMRRKIDEEVQRLTRKMRWNFAAFHASPECESCVSRNEFLNMLASLAFEGGPLPLPSVLRTYVMEASSNCAGIIRNMMCSNMFVKSEDNPTACISFDSFCPWYSIHATVIRSEFREQFSAMQSQLSSKPQATHENTKPSVLLKIKSVIRKHRAVLPSETNKMAVQRLCVEERIRSRESVRSIIQTMTTGDYIAETSTAKRVSQWNSSLVNVVESTESRLQPARNLLSLFGVSNKKRARDDIGHPSMQSKNDHPSSDFLAEMDAYMETANGKRELRAAAVALKKQLKDSRKGGKAVVKKTQIETLKDTFNSFDIDQSGAIDGRELPDLLRELCIPFKEAEVGDILARLDTDKSGDISFSEFYRWYRHVQTQRQNPSSVDSARKMKFKIMVHNTLGAKGSSAKGRARRVVIYNHWKARQEGSSSST
jgi:Ca2+-binding EF-hand superfamily protein